MSTTSFYTTAELAAIGFKSVGEHVFISRKTSIYGATRISIGNHVRIDDFCVLSAGKEGIDIGNYVHMAVFCNLQGDAAIVIEDFVGLSSRVAIYSSNDDYLGQFMTNPTVPTQYTGVTSAPVYLKKHVLVGSGSVILPGITLHEGVAIGALSLVLKNCDAFYIYSGNPAEKLMRRSKRLLQLETALKEAIHSTE
jgi:dTDP-4-amino-4,6-dideoxy-D-glucose acyltransferase